MKYFKHCQANSRDTSLNTYRPYFAYSTLDSRTFSYIAVVHFTRINTELEWILIALFSYGGIILAWHKLKWLRLFVVTAKASAYAFLTPLSAFLITISVSTTPVKSNVFSSTSQKQHQRGAITVDGDSKLILIVSLVVVTVVMPYYKKTTVSLLYQLWFASITPFSGINVFSPIYRI